MHSKVCRPIVDHLESTVRVVMRMDHMKKAGEEPQTTSTLDALTQFIHLPQTLSQLCSYCKDKLGCFLGVFLYSFTFILFHFSKESPHFISIPSVPSFFIYPHLPLFPGIPSSFGEPLRLSACGDHTSHHLLHFHCQTSQA